HADPVAEDVVLAKTACQDDQLLSGSLCGVDLASDLGSIGGVYSGSGAGMFNPALRARRPALGWHLKARDGDRDLDPRLWNSEHADKALSLFNRDFDAYLRYRSRLDELEIGVAAVDHGRRRIVAGVRHSRSPTRRGPFRSATSAGACR